MTHRLHRGARSAALASLALALALSGCQPEHGHGDPPTDDGPTDETEDDLEDDLTEDDVTPDDGPMDDGPVDDSADGFLSADTVPTRQDEDPVSGDDGGDGDGDGDGDEGDGSGERTVEEGDIYRVLGDGLLLNLNAYRGVQVLDIGDPTQPSILGRVRGLSGSPVEAYVVGDHAIVLLNDFTGYWGTRDDVQVERRDGGLVVSVDLSDPSNPTITDREFVTGSVLTSRLTRQGEHAALYVAAQSWDSCAEPGDGDGDDDDDNDNSGDGDGDGGDGDGDGDGDAIGKIGCDEGTLVKSFDVSGGAIEPRSELQLGGYVSAVQGTPSALIVARQVYDEGGGSTAVNLIDISGIDGTMIEGAQVRVAGYVQNKFNLDLAGGVLRVVSAGGWDDLVNHLETFDASSLAALTPIDHCAFGPNESLFATLFMPDRAFFVTYEQVDPFHAFALSADGHCEERSQYVVTGWNDFFKPVAGGTRLIGIGHNDETSSVSVSLYDAANLDNAEPLLARKDVAFSNSWSTANWDDKAFSVIEGAVSVPAGGAPGTLETGLVLLPFSGYRENVGYRSAVQIYTFSATTLTRRGLMEHGTWVQRTFQPAAALTANLSAAELSLFDTQNPDEPQEKGRVELAPAYNQVLDYGDFVVRIHDTRSDYYYDDISADSTAPESFAEVVLASEHPDEGPAVASIPIAAGARALRAGSHLVIVDTRGEYANEQVTYTSKLSVYDLTNPAAPVARGELTTERLLPAYGYGWYGDEGSDFCGEFDGYYYDDFSRVLGDDVVVFGRNLPQSKSLGTVRTCYEYPTEGGNCWGPEEPVEDEGPTPDEPLDDDDGLDGTGGDGDGDGDGKNCDYYTGNIQCSGPLGAEPTCTGDIQHCVDGTCEAVDPSTISTSRECYVEEQQRHWQSLELDVLDLRDPAHPKLETVKLDVEDESVGLVAAGDAVYHAFKRPAEVENDDRAYVRYYFQKVELENPEAPVLGPKVNVPGELIAVDGENLYTRDLRWNDHTAETWVHLVDVGASGPAIVQSHHFASSYVERVVADGAGNVLVSYYQDSGDYQSHLSLFDPALALKSDTVVDSWADLNQAKDGKALFTVPGGLLVVGYSDPTLPKAQAYFPHVGWFQDVAFNGQDIMVAAGRYGVHVFDASTENLLSD